MGNRTHEQAMAELHARISQHMRDLVNERVPLLTGNTVESLVDDIADSTMRGIVLDLLRIIKIRAFLETVTTEGLMTQEERDELIKAVQDMWQPRKVEDEEA